MGNIRAMDLSFLPRIAAALIAAVALMLVGCGEDNRDEIQGVLKGFDAALANGDGASACTYLSESTLVEIEREGSCPAIARRLTTSGGGEAQAIKALHSADVSDVMVRGTVATAKVRPPGGRTESPVELVEEAGKWRISETPLGP